MAKQTIGIGVTLNDGTGDPLRTAFDKANDNFDELYAPFGDAPGVKQTIPLTNPTLQDVIDALVNLGLIEQADV